MSLRKSLKIADFLIRVSIPHVILNQRGSIKSEGALRMHGHHTPQQVWLLKSFTAQDLGRGEQTTREQILRYTDELSWLVNKKSK